MTAIAAVRRWPEKQSVAVSVYHHDDITIVFTISARLYPAFCSVALCCALTSRHLQQRLLRSEENARFATNDIIPETTEQHRQLHR